MTLYFSNSELHNFADELANEIMPINLCTDDKLFIDSVNLYLKEDGLYIYSKEFKPLNLLEFYREFIAKRRQLISRENLIQAINLTKLKSHVNELNALDLTGGLGRDSILLALAGFNVIVIERNKYLAIILRYLSIKFMDEVKINLIFTDSYEYMSHNQVNYDIIYFDPMFEDSKKALSKKDMQLIDLLISNDDIKLNNINNDVFFKQITSYCNKLIVKRDNKQAHFFTLTKPTYQKLGKTIRFDVYQGSLLYNN
ncbi:MAG: class I SAM-dependent methyltransferase [Burkholderiales bacterium]|nr:class I SAM-dependent methyltransferase [Burkholderiales bacterium]